MPASIRLFLSASISFIFYFAWAYWANSMVTDDRVMLTRTAMIQGSYSAFMTAGFTFALEWAILKFRSSHFPTWIVAPLPPLTLQSILVIGINIANNTPNLWLTVAPSILFSGLYGYAYCVALLRKID